MISKEVTRRAFLKYMIAGGAALAAKPSLLWGETLEDKIKRRRIDALHPGPRGQHIAGYRFPLKIKDKIFPYMKGEEIKFNVRFEYFQGPKGVGGALRTFVYLDEKDWYSRKAIRNLKLIFYSTKKTSVSKEIYEVNVDRHKGRVTHCSLDYVILPGDYFAKKFESSVYTILKKAKINKKDIKKVFWVKDLFEDIKDQDLLEKIIEKGNDITGQSVHIKTADYNGFGLLDDNLLNGEKRNPKLVRVELLRGDQSVEAVGIILKVVDFRETKMGTGNLFGSADYFFDFNVKKLSKDINIPKGED
ncbi:MAG: hypothetical protein IB618_03090 [Candidatus Pacearchaeota archaeon]|nr:MAG: hypothetical protein IB618_03090 [Candidatus Pacearchaeota archaeon]